MAVKPVVQPEVWASNALYTTGPFIGSASKAVPPGAVAAEGHRPGAAFPTPAEFENSQQNAITLLSRWVFAGSSAGAADAHIVETDGTGRATLHGLTVTNTTTQTCVFATGNSAGLPVYRATQPTGGDGFLANLSGSAGSAFSSELSGTSKGLEIEMDTVAAPGAGVSVVADAATTAEALTITHAGTTNHAASITATGASCMALRLEASDDAGLYVDGGVTSSAAILAVGKDDAAGIRGSGGPSGGNGVEGIGTGSNTAGVFGLADQYGVSGLSTNATSGFGVYGESDNAAGLGGGGVYGNGQNLGSGVFGESVDGYGGLFTADGARQTVFMSSRISDPTQTLTGGLWNRQTLGLSTFVANTARRVWHTAGGAGIAMASSIAGGTVDSTPTVVATATMTGANAPVAAGGTVWLMVTAEVGRNAAGAADLELQVTDITQGVVIIDNTTVGDGVIPLFQDGPTYEKFVTLIVPWPVDAAGTRSFTLTLASSTAVDLQYRNVGFAVLGVF